jgi:hypothetical protein
MVPSTSRYDRRRSVSESPLRWSIAIVAASTRGSPVPVGGIERGDAGSIVFFVALAVGFALYASGRAVRIRGL